MNKLVNIVSPKVAKDLVQLLGVLPEYVRVEEVKTYGKPQGFDTERELHNSIVKVIE